MQFFSSEPNSAALLSLILGGFILLFGLVSFVVKEKLFLSESLVATLVGIAFGPIAIGAIDPFKWDIDVLTLEFSEIVVCIQIMNAAVNLPKKFWTVRWKSVLFLLLPVMTYQWLSTALILYLILQRSWIESLIIAACAAPTDPILANSVVSGRFADIHIPVPIRQLISAESASNDGFALPMFMISLFLYKYPIQKAFAVWGYYTLAYEICVSIVLGIILGYVARITLRYAETHNMIDKKSFFSFEIAFTLFVLGLASVIHVSTFIAVFVSGFVFSWDGWFQVETEEAHVQEVIDLLLNLSFFIYFGTMIPWTSFGELSVWRLIVSSIVILILRRLPIVLILHRFIPPLYSLKEASLVGWFGPIGVGALWYAAYAAVALRDNSAILDVTCFLVLVSVISFGITVPFAHITMVTITSFSRPRDVSVPHWPSDVPFGDRSLISRPTLMEPVKIDEIRQEVISSTETIQNPIVSFSEPIEASTSASSKEAMIVKLEN